MPKRKTAIKNVAVDNSREKRETVEDDEPPTSIMMGEQDQ